MSARLENGYNPQSEQKDGIGSMSEQFYHQSLRLENFTVFRDTTLDFVAGINAFVGENGTGKTHIMKMLYAAQLTQARELRSISSTLTDLFQTQNLADLIRLGTAEGVWAVARGQYHSQNWLCDIQRDSQTEWHGTETRLKKAARPVFIPAIDMMGHTKGFLAAKNEVVLDFDLTCSDIVSLLDLKRKNNENQQEITYGLAELLGGKLEYEENTGRFYLATSLGRIPMPLVAEGLRKIATLVRLTENGWLTPGTTLFWDEPEVNLNPKLMDEVIGAILALTRAGIQVFMATHSYVILKELDLQAKQTDSIRFFGFQHEDNETTVNATDDFALLEPNPILEQYDRLYDLELTRATGRNRHGERVR